MDTLRVCQKATILNSGHAVLICATFNQVSHRVRKDSWQFPPNYPFAPIFDRVDSPTLPAAHKYHPTDSYITYDTLIPPILHAGCC